MRFIFNDTETQGFEYAVDVDRIVKAFAHRGNDISHADAKLAWEAYSDSMCAGWINLPQNKDFSYDDDQLVSSIMPFLKKVW